MKKIPELVDQREHCCGCSACYSICPVRAIKMIPDIEGFLYPSINPEKCIRCNKCMEVCAFKQDQKIKNLF